MTDTTVDEAFDHCAQLCDVVVGKVNVTDTGNALVETFCASVRATVELCNIELGSQSSITNASLTVPSHIHADSVPRFGELLSGYDASRTMMLACIVGLLTAALAILVAIRCSCHTRSYRRGRRSHLQADHYTTFPPHLAHFEGSQGAASNRTSAGAQQRTRVPRRAAHEAKAQSGVAIIDKECVVCRDNSAVCAGVAARGHGSCGHITTCVTCSRALARHEAPFTLVKCSVCRAPLSHFMRCY
jgi:hypothetical protein